MCKVIAVSNQKGGVGKTVSCVNLGIGLAQEGKKVLLIDGDPQGSLTISLGYEEPDEMEYSLATLMMNIVNDEKLNIEKTILHHKEGVDLIPANIELSAIEVSLVNAMSRELILRSMVEKLRDFYDFIIIDCMPSLGMMTINALACADSVLIPVQAAYLPVKGLQQLIKTIGRVKKQLNPKLKIEGILLTMVDNRTNYARDISLMVYDTYSASIKVFGTEIPMSVRASEVSVEGGSIYSYDPKGKAAFAYMALTKEVLKEASSRKRTAPTTRSTPCPGWRRRRKIIPRFLSSACGPMEPMKPLQRSAVYADTLGRKSEIWMTFTWMCCSNDLKIVTATLLF